MKKHPGLSLTTGLMIVAGAVLVIAQSNRPAVTNGACCASLTNPALLASMVAPATNAPAVAPEKKGLPKLLDLGAGKCIPCKMMAPILEEMKKEYAGTLEVEVIDVWKNPDAGKQYKIEVIPTQIFYDATGKVSGGSAFGGALSGFANSYIGADALDVDAYVTNKALDGLFKMVADEEKRIRENPVARTSDLLQKVFGAAAK